MAKLIVEKTGDVGCAAVVPRRASTVVDARGYRISGANAQAADTYEQALAAFQCWRNGADLKLGLALQDSPGFVMAHVLQAYMLLCGRDPVRVLSARPVLARVAGLPANQRERMHVAVIAAALADDFKSTRDRLDELLRQYPRDVLALQVAHAFDYLIGDIERMRTRVGSVLPAWSRAMPGYHAVLAMHAFSMEECGDYETAEDEARAALALNPLDARAHHVMAHVFEMTVRPDAGLRWMAGHRDGWNDNTLVATHCWWHFALFLLARGQLDAALRLYDARIRAGYPAAIADLIDASALLWRIELMKGDTGQRWPELAAAWEPHIDDGFCSFTDLHAMLAFVGAGEHQRIARFERALLQRQSQPTRYGTTTQQFGLAACQALAAFGRGDNERALVLLAGLPPVAHRFGGSHAQRDVLYLTLLEAAQRIQRAGARPGTRAAVCAVAA
jgi:tetratricopeptide (TPR) repeat protein